MNFNEKLISGELIKRYKRFFADVKIGKNIITAHCPNTGSMMGLLKEGNKVWVSKSQNPNRKLKYTLEIIEVEKNKVGINTHSTNKIFLKALKDKKLKIFKVRDIKIKHNRSSSISFNNNTEYVMKWHYMWSMFYYYKKKFHFKILN